MYIGCDIGRGDTKVFSDKDVFKFPSYVAEARTLDLESGEMKSDSNNMEHLSVEIDGDKFFLGELARREGGSREYQKDKVKHRNTIPLLLTSIALASPDKYCKAKVVTGVPISDYQTQGKKFEKEITGSYRIKLPHKEVYLQLLKNNILTFPEGAGAIWNELLDDHGQLLETTLTDQVIGVLDVGWKTVNFAVLRKMQYDDGASGTLPMGLSKAFKIYYKRISRRYDLSPSQAEKSLISKGQQELIRLSQEIQDQISMWWTNGLELDCVFIAGGGGKALFDHLNFQKKRLLDEPQMANAEGYYKVAQMKL